MVCVKKWALCIKLCIKPNRPATVYFVYNNNKTKKNKKKSLENTGILTEKSLFKI